MLEASPEHIFGKKILVVDEQPVLELIIGKKSYLTGIFTGYGVIIVFIITVVLIQKKRNLLK